MKAVEDGLWRLEGVNSVNVTLQTNLVTITLDPSVELDLLTIPDAIRESGFSPGEMYVRARGTFEKQDTSWRFRIQSWRRTILLSSAPPRREETKLYARVDYSGNPVRLIPDDR